MIALGLGLLRLSPRDFWAMTPRELSHVLGVLGGGGAEASPPTRSALHALMRMFPDKEERPER